MVAVVFDTLELVRKLQERGFPQSQAEGISDAFRDVMSVAEIATKHDVDALRVDVEKLDLRFQAEFKVLKWMIGVATAGIISLVFKSFF
ncbi:MAG: CCDC90 family protein [Azoarcus sp.]|nr:CCDC90 family protein [Azoarcus sp.]